MLLEEVETLLKNFQDAFGLLSEDILVIDLQSALEKLGLITGETSSEDLLETIFKNFCLGKWKWCQSYMKSKIATMWLW